MSGAPGWRPGGGSARVPSGADWSDCGPGAGVPDVEKAFKLDHQAAEAGQPHAQFNLGHCYAKGDGVRKDVEEAKKLWMIAHEAGYASARARAHDRNAQPTKSFLASGGAAGRGNGDVVLAVHGGGRIVAVRSCGALGDALGGRVVDVC